MLSVALGQMEVVPGRPDLNCRAMLALIESARQRGAHLIAFPELAIPGYLLGDTWEQTAFLKDCECCGQQIIRASKGIAVIFGNVAVDWQRKGDDGRVRKYNACFVAQDGLLQGGENFPYPFHIKSLQPNYREFDDERHFYSLRKLALELNRPPADLLQPVRLTLAGRNLALGCLLCEDGWSDDYDFKPMQALHERGAGLFVNISSSPFTLGKNDKRHRVFARQARAAGAPLVYVNNTGVQNNGKTVYTFDGASCVYAAGGGVASACPPFQADLAVVDLDDLPAGSQAPGDWEVDSVFRALSFGIGRFLAATGIERVVVGVSGGIDSAVAAALYAKVLGPERVLLVNMPSVYNSATTRGLAAELARNLAALYAVAPIQASVDQTVAQIEATPVTDLATGRQFHLPLSALAKENIQARDRSARILAAFAAAFNAAFTCNGNKSELTVGYATLYGDLAGFLAALGDLWKHQVYSLGRYLNDAVYGRPVIPQGIMDLTPSAELSTDQDVDQGRGDPLVYPYHDFLFRAFVERWERATPADILEWYASGTLEQEIGCAAGLVARLFPDAAAFTADLERWWRLYTGLGVAKRIQAPPVLAVSRRAFGFDHREAQNGPYLTAAYLRLKEELLARG